MSVSAKMSVDTSGFVNGMNTAAASIKTLNAQLKQNEAALKLTGNQEAFVTAQSGTLNKKMQEEQKTVERLTKALAELDKKGTDPNTKSYQKLQQQLAKAQTDLMGTQARIQELGTKSGDAAGKTDKLASSVASIGRKMSLDQVIGGIDRITSGLEAGAKKALELGKNLWNGIEESAAKADDIATQATILGMDIEDYQRYYKVFETIGDITVSDWRKAKKKVQAAINNPSEEQTNIFNLLGIQTHEGYQGKYGYVEGVARNFEDILWEAGGELRRRVNAGELSADLADTYANALFGKSFDNLNPLFKLGRTAFDEALKNQNVTSQEAIDKLAALNDELIKTKGDFESLKLEVLSGMAPALTKAASVLDSLLGRVMDYLKTPEGKKALEGLEKSVSGLFEDLDKIDPEKVVEGFVGVFDKVVGGIEWVVEHKQEVIDALKAILDGWGKLKLVGAAADLLKLVNGLTTLGGGLLGKLLGLGGGSSAAAGAASTAAEAAGATVGGTTLRALVSKAVPWLKGGTGAYFFLKTLFDVDGNALFSGTPDREHYGQFYEDDGSLTKAGIEAGLDPNDPEIKRSAAYSKWKHEQTIEALEDLLGYKDYDPGALSFVKQLADRSNAENFGEWISNMQQRYLDWWYKDAPDPELDAAIENMDDAVFTRFQEALENFGIADGSMGPVEWDQLFADVQKNLEDNLAKTPYKIEVDPQVPENAGEIIAAQIGTVKIQTVLSGVSSFLSAALAAHSHANGIWNVPSDNYLAFLHAGERVVPAREISNRSYNSNLYVEKMIMNNNQDAEGLAGAMAARQRRTMRGFGQ